MGLKSKLRVIYADDFCEKIMQENDFLKKITFVLSVTVTGILDKIFDMKGISVCKRLLYQR